MRKILVAALVALVLVVISGLGLTLASQRVFDPDAARARAVALAIEGGGLHDLVGDAPTTGPRSSRWERNLSFVTLEERIVLTGPRGRADVEYAAWTPFRRWQIESLTVSVDGREVCRLSDS